MAKVALLTMHGMGETQPDYHLGLVKALQGELKGLFAGVRTAR